MAKKRKFKRKKVLLNKLIFACENYNKILFLYSILLLYKKITNIN
jgi:hypothetical protein